jgi:uncharacterized protein YdaU (DUF1376 family)
MHYYKRNLGDYAKKAGRLTMLQHGAYTLLIDSCYDREIFPTLDQALEWTWASTEAEVEAVKFVLTRFFTLDKDNCYVQDRILQELLHYHKNADTNKRIADEREAKRREKSTNRVPSVNEATPNQEPLTTNNKPIKENKRGSRLALDFCFTKEWEDFCIQARPELSPDKTFDQFKDYWIAQAGQKGVKLDWFATWRNWVRSTNAPKQNPYDVVRLTVPSKNEPDPALEKIKADDKKAVPPSLEVLAKMAQLRKVNV